MSKILLNTRSLTLFFFLFKDCSFNNIQRFVLSDNLLKFFVDDRFKELYYYFLNRLLYKAQLHSFFSEYLKSFCEGSFLFYFKDNKLFAVLERFLMKGAIFKLYSDFFSNKLKKSKVYEYKDFNLRVPIEVFFFLGKNAEYLRMFKYNEYISITDSLNNKWFLKRGLRAPFLDRWRLFHRHRFYSLINKYSVYGYVKKRKKKKLWDIQFFRNKVQLPFFNVLVEKFKFIFFESLNKRFLYIFHDVFGLYIFHFMFLSWNTFKIFRYFRKFKPRLFYYFRDFYGWFFRPFRFTWFVILSHFFYIDLYKLSKKSTFSITNFLNYKLVSVRELLRTDLFIVRYLSIHYYKLLKYFHRTYQEAALLYFRLLWVKFTVFLEIKFFNLGTKLLYFQDKQWKYFLKKIKYNLNTIYWEVMNAGIHKKHYNYYKKPQLLFVYQDVEKFINYLNLFYYNFFMVYLEQFVIKFYKKLFCILMIYVFGDLISKHLNINQSISQIFGLVQCFYFYKKNIVLQQYKLNYWKFCRTYKYSQYDSEVLGVINLDSICTEYPINIEKSWDLMDTSRW